MSATTRRLTWLTVVTFLFAAAPAGAQDAPDAAAKDRQIQELQAKVQKLEARLAEVEKLLAQLMPQAGAAASPAQPAAAGTAGQGAGAAAQGQVPEAQRKKLAARAQQRMRQDLQKHTREQLGEAEKLYQVANANWRTPQARQSLEQMVAKFPNVNRTGCAVLYLAQYSQGEEREKLLKQAIDQYSDCFYGNGVQVGAFARYLLGLHYHEAGMADEAKQLFDEIRKKYPDAITHRGESLVAKLPA